MLQLFSHAGHSHVEAAGIPALAFVAFLLVGMVSLAAVAVYVKKRSK